MLKETKSQHADMVSTETFKAIFQYLSLALQNLNQVPEFNESCVRAVLQLLCQILESHPKANAKLQGNKSVHQVVEKFVTQRKSLKVCGLACLLIRCLLFDNQVA
jgi:hypothetical protein